MSIEVALERQPLTFPKRVVEVTCRGLMSAATCHAAESPSASSTLKCSYHGPGPVDSVLPLLKSSRRAGQLPMIKIRLIPARSSETAVLLWSCSRMLRVLW